MAELVLDKDYDTAAMGAVYGYLALSMYVTPKNLTATYAAEQLLQMKSALEAAGVGFSSIALFMTVRESKNAYQSLGINRITVENLDASVPARLEQMRIA